ncbi:MAG: hypothetical protein JST55_14745 [Bacteroidetes bacterium]|nr:hypothetical protein [Bacteroidota bacterium]
MKNIFVLFVILCTQIALSFSNKNETLKDSTKCVIKKYDSPTNDVIYISAIDKKVKLSELSDWIEKDTSMYTAINYYYNSAGINDNSYEEINMSVENGKMIPKFQKGDGNYVELTSVRIKGNKFYSVLTMNGTSEELNGKFVKLKAPPNTESPFVYGLLINRKGVWKFFFMYV